MKIGNNGNLVLLPFDESTPYLMIVLMNCQTKLRINHLTAVKSVAILENGVIGLEGDNDEEEKSTPLTGKLIQEGLQLCSKLENHFLINDPNSERASKLQKTISSDDEGDLEPLLKRCKPLSDSDND
ncbi:hypothetical protein TNCV_2174391 [Trichonephila clavipes]|nr:hypothetical protein TNCV_2174391 [Trichonephila clavipes]